LRRQEFYTGFYREREKLPLRCAYKPYIVNVIQGIPMEAEAQWSGGLNCSSDEVSVMEMERRVQLIGLH
jgi:hypothetical protein